jgi:hypothetical protein
VSLTRSSAVLELGKRLVELLDGQDDLLTAWMAHYIAERMEEAEHASGEAKQDANVICAHAILELWRYRSCLPKHIRPFAELESIQRALTSLDVDRSDYRYYPTILREAASTDSDDDAKQWLDLAIGLDYSARVLIKSSLRAAALRASAQAQPWVELARCAGADEGFESVVVDFVRECDNEITADQANQHEALANQVTRLESFAELAMLVARDLRAEIGDVGIDNV